MSLTVTDMAALGKALRFTAPAKINLVLDVLRRREDGYHDIESLAVGIGLYDRLTVVEADTAGVQLECDVARLETADNLVCRAVRLLARRLHREPACRITLEKRIPVAVGLGGGSSDAASALRLCRDLWSGAWNDGDLARWGADLGSDVPLFFSLPAALVTGRGEIVQPVSLRWSGWVLLIFVNEPVPTAPVYRAWTPDDSPRREAGRVEAILTADSARDIMPLLSNDLEPAIRRVAPRVGEAFDGFTAAGLGPLCLSGAGSTLYQLFDEKEEATTHASKIESLGFNVRTTVVAAPVGPGRVYHEELG